MFYDRLHALWLTQSRLTTLLPSLIATRRVGPQTFWWLRPKNFPRSWLRFDDLSLVGPTGFLLLQRFGVGLAAEYSSCFISVLYLNVCSFDALMSSKSFMRTDYMFISHRRTLGEGCQHVQPVYARTPPPVIYYRPFQGGASVAVYSDCLC